MGKKPNDSAFTKAARRVEAERTRAALSAESARKRAAAQEAKADKLAKKSAAIGRLSLQAAEAAQLLKEFPDLARPYLEEFGGMAPVAKAGPQPPNGAAMKAARQTLLDMIADRWDEAENEWIDADERDKEQPDVWVVTRGVLEFVKRMTFEELFAARPKPKEATDTAPRSPDRVEAMAARQEAGEDLYHPDDATPASTGKKLNVRDRKNGGRRGGSTTAKKLGGEERQPDDELNQEVLGWLEDEPGEPESLKDEAAREAEKIRAKAAERKNR